MLDIYNFTAITLFFVSLSTFFCTAKVKKTRTMLKISCIWLILYEGLRWEVGTDWTYYDAFVEGLDFDGHCELGYVVLNNIFRAFSPDYSIFLFSLSAFFYIVIYHIVGKYSISPLLSLCIYYCSLLGYLGCNRQLIALMVCLCSLRFIFERKKKPFFVLITIAFLFHTTSLVFLPAYFIANKNNNIKFIIYAFSIAFIIGLSGIVNHLPFVNYLAFLDVNTSEKLEFYTNQNVINAYSYFGTLKRLFIVIPLISLLRKNIVDYKDSVFIKFYIIGTIIYLFFNGSILMLISGRGAMYYSVMEIFVVPILLKYLIREKKSMQLIWSMYFLLLLYLMNRDMNFYVLAGVGDIYHPYKLTFFKQ